jgi:hypothetical protein
MCLHGLDCRSLHPSCSQLNMHMHTRSWLAFVSQHLTIFIQCIWSPMDRGLHRYCRFYQGRRSDDDARQISRWAKAAGVKGRWRGNLIGKVCSLSIACLAIVSYNCVVLNLVVLKREKLVRQRAVSLRIQKQLSICCFYRSAITVKEK